MPIGKIEQFDLGSKKWSAYVRRVEQYMSLNQIKSEHEVATLVVLVGEATYDLMCDLCAPDNPESKTFKELVKTVSDHLEPRRSEIAERHVFRQRRQKIGENLSEYLQALKHLASTCEFNASLEENLRDQFVSGLASEDMRSRLFAEPKLTYKKAIELALALEAADRHAQASSSGYAQDKVANVVAPSAEPVHRVAAARAVAAAQLCWRCGRTHRPDVCRFKNYSCDVCGQKGHIKVMCKRGPAQGNREERKWRKNTRSGNNYIDSDDESEYNFCNLNVCGSNDRPFQVLAQVNGCKIMFELDTGSKLSTINWSDYCDKFSGLPILSNNVCLRSYTGTIIEPMGFILVDVVVGKHSAGNLKLFVIKNGGPPLLGRSWLRKLDINNVQINDFLYKINESCLVEELQREFPTVFASGLGTCTKKISLKLRVSTPIFIKARPLPLALRKPVELELQRLEAEGTIRKVEYSDYGTPIVPIIKKCGGIRICGDYKVTVNPFLIREPYPLPRIEELFAALSGGEKYSKVDLTNAYQQLFLDEASQACTAITTHVGTFVYERTPFGLTCIPEKFQKFMEETLTGLTGVAVFMDDIAITGKNTAEHISNLRALFRRLRDAGLRIKLEKCSFMQDSINYVGFIIDKYGLHPDPSKIKAIVDAPAPTDVTQLRSFLGFVNYYSKFICNLSSILYPLHKLLRKNSVWIWSSECDQAFKSVKSAILSNDVLAHYDHRLPLVLAVDSSSCGIGSVLSHRYSDGSERPICFASRTLNAAEWSYSQLDKEALAIISGVLKHHQYLYGRQFIIKTDHKPLTFIFGSKFGLPQMAASRLQRYATKLAAYDFKIEFVKSKDNSNADALSRLPLPLTHQCYKEIPLESVSFLNYVEETFPISAREVADETHKDNVLKTVLKYILSDWPSKMDSDEFKPYFHRKDSLTVERGCILYNSRVVIPQSLRKQILYELHVGHLGVVKMKNIARNLVYWPQLDTEIEKITRDCSACVQQRDAPARSLLHPWVYPSRPWQRIHVDFAQLNNRHYLVTVDAHSKWIEVQKMDGTNANATIVKLRELFARFGLPSQVVSDGGPPFGSSEFSEFMRKNLITHTITSPYRPAGNGAAENAVKSVKRAMKKALHENMDIDTALTLFLFQYRNCEHATTGVAPAVALLGRRLRGRLDVLHPNALTTKAVEMNADRAGNLKPGAERHVSVGDCVLARNYRPHQDKWAAGCVTAREAPLTYKVRLTDGEVWKRHIDQILPINKAPTRSGLRNSLINSQPTNDEILTSQSPLPNEIVEPPANDHNDTLDPAFCSNPTNNNTMPQIKPRPKRACTFAGKYSK